MKKRIKQQLRGLGFGEKVNAFIIGTQKCGATTLHNTLVQHPEIYGPGPKSKADYMDLYPFLIRPGFRVLDSTPGYIAHEGTIRKIFDYNPNAKFIFLPRNPVKRAISAWIMLHYTFPQGSSWRGLNVHDPSNIPTGNNR